MINECKTLSYGIVGSECNIIFGGGNMNNFDKLLKEFENYLRYKSKPSAEKNHYSVHQACEAV